jgi:hypothetical protein
MNCGTPFTLEHMETELGFNWVKAKMFLPKAYELLSSEKARFQQTLPYVERQKTINKLRSQRAELGLVVKKQTAILKSITDRPFVTIPPTVDYKTDAPVEWYRAKAKIDETKARLSILQAQINSAARSDHWFNGIGPEQTVAIHCPNAGCSGIVNATGKCVQCEAKVCLECHELLESQDDIDGSQQHTCDSETLETIKQLKLDSKPCPTCHVTIHKIEGCDQMWCTKCHATFSWTTGAILNEHVHNPHFYEHNEGNGGAMRNIGDRICGGMPERQEYRQQIMTLKKAESPPFHISDVRVSPDLLALITIGDEIDHLLDGFREELLDEPIVLREARVKYIMGGFKCDDEYVKKCLLPIVRNRYILRNKIAILETTSVCLIDSVRTAIGAITGLTENEVTSHILPLKQMTYDAFRIYFRCRKSIDVLKAYRTPAQNHIYKRRANMYSSLVAFE